MDAATGIGKFDALPEPLSDRQADGGILAFHWQDRRYSDQGRGDTRWLIGGGAQDLQVIHQCPAFPMVKLKARHQRTQDVTAAPLAELDGLKYGCRIGVARGRGGPCEQGLPQ